MGKLKPRGIIIAHVGHGSTVLQDALIQAMGEGKKIMIIDDLSKLDEIQKEHEKSFTIPEPKIPYKLRQIFDEPQQEPLKVTYVPEHPFKKFKASKRRKF